jgi:uncharacterized protein (DUF983 family)
MYAYTILFCIAGTSKGVIVMADLSVSLAGAMWRGFRSRCPCCGKGRLFNRFLKVVERCPNCGEELFHHRADDFPAYLAIMVVGHVVVPAALAVEASYAPPVSLQLSLWLPITAVASLALLQPIKGAVVGLQWQTGMHGFEVSRRRRANRRAAPTTVESKSLQTS